MMDYSPTAAERDLRNQVREFLAEALERDYRPGLGLAARHDPEFSRKLAERGWVGMAIPPEYGGHGRSAVERFIVTEELLAAGAPIGAHYVADRQTAPALLNFGSEQQRERFLPTIAAGQCYFSLGMSEPEAGSDLAAVRSNARQVDGGWLVNGTKVWTSNAHLNHYIVVLCRTAPSGEDRHSGLSQFIVDLHASGVSVRGIPFLDGTVHFNEVQLDDVFVENEMMLGKVGSGWEQVISELAYERSGPDRYMSTLPVVKEFVRALRKSAVRADGYEAVGQIAGRLWGIRQLSWSNARALDTGAASSIRAALVKDLGTSLEQLSVELMRLATPVPIVPDEPDLLGSLLAEAMLNAPSFTLRGGATEILRSVIAKGFTG